MRNTYEDKKAFVGRLEAMRDRKRERDEAKRWKRFEMSREAFDEEAERIVDVYEYMEGK